MHNQRSLLDFPRNEAGLVDKFIGTAFDAVYQIYLNLEEVLKSKGYSELALQAKQAAEAAAVLAAKSAEESAASAAIALQNAELIVSRIEEAIAARDAAEASAILALGYVELVQAAVIQVNGDRVEVERLAQETSEYAAQVGPIRADLADTVDPLKGAYLIGHDGERLSNQLNLSKKLASYEALVAYKGPATRVELTGFGISGNFTLVSGTFTHDGAIFILGAEGRVWQRENAYPVLARWFGFGLNKISNNTALSNANTAASRLGAGIVQLDPGNFNMDSTPVQMYSNIRTKGCGKKSTTLNVSPNSTSVLFDYALAPGSYNEGGLNDLTIKNTGPNIGLAAVRTPQDAAGFNSAQKFNWDGLGFEGNGWSVYMDLGDCAMASARNIELRGQYNATLPDTDQADCIGVLLSGLKGNVRTTIDSFAMLGIRRGLVMGECCEGFVLTNGEITSTWIGVFSSQVTAKPGGFIDNVHISCNKAGISMTNRRDMTLGTVQIYRSNGMYDHGTDWNAYTLANCRRITLPSLLVRVFPGVFTGNNIAVAMSGASDKCYVEDLTLSEVGGVTRAVNVSSATNCGVDEISCEGVDEWVHLGGTVNNWHTRQINSPTLGSNVFAIGSSVDRATLQLPKISCVRAYTESTYAVATDVTWKARQSSAVQKISVTGSTAITVNVTLDYATATVDDMFDVHLVLTTGAVKTVNFIDPRTGTAVTVLTVAGSASANTFKNITFRFNGAGWVIHRNADGLA